MKDEVYCNACDGTNVQSTYWFHHGTGEVLDHFTDFHETSTGGVWCDDCQEHTPLAERKVKETA